MAVIDTPTELTLPNTNISRGLYHELLRLGRVPERSELLHGKVVPKAVAGPEHNRLGYRLHRALLLGLIKRLELEVHAERAVAVTEVWGHKRGGHEPHPDVFVCDAGEWLTDNPTTEHLHLCFIRSRSAAARRMG